MTTRRALLCLGLAIVSVGFFMFQKFSEPTAVEVLKAEQEIYTALLSDQKYAYNDSPDEIQVIEFTNSGKFQLDIPIGGAGIYGSSDTIDFPGLQRTTRLDFQKKNNKSYPIKNYLPDSANVILVNPTNGEQLYWWVSFSRIGFNPSLTQALVLIGDCRGASCYDSTNVSMYSFGYYVLLEKEDGKWVIKNQKSLWHIEAPAP